MPSSRVVRVGVLGAGAWANFAHLPGFKRDVRCALVAIADPRRDLAHAAAQRFDIPSVTADHRELIERDDIDLIDVCTPSHTHFELAWAALDAGKHVLCEKPVAYDFHDTRRAAAFARSKGLKTKLGFTFRYAPSMRYMRELVREGFVGDPFIFNGYEQNSQWLDPKVPLRQVDPEADQSILHVSSLEGYGAPIIDIGHLLVGSDLTSVVGTMRNFIPERMVRQTERMMRMNIDDGDIFIGEFANGALGSVQTSFVTIGNYPGIEARLYGSKGALICRLVEEEGICERLYAATANQVEFRELPVPDRFYPAGGSRTESWRSLFYANLVSSFISEILADTDSRSRRGGSSAFADASADRRSLGGGWLDPPSENEGNFEDGAWVQETINAVEQSFRGRRWVNLPLP